jgi:SH3-like domain-containing protein
MLWQKGRPYSRPLGLGAGYWPGVVLFTLAWLLASPLWAAEIYAVNSESVPLNVRSGPGIEYEVLTRLPHGTKVSVLERAGLWVKITPPNGPAEGWVLERYLVAIQSPTPTAAAEQSLEQEQRRFARLQRKGVITTQRLEDVDVLRLTINPLLWSRLTPQEQQSFLQRAKQLFGGSTVEIYDHHDTLLAYMSPTGAFETVPESPGGSVPPAASPSVSIPPGPSTAPKRPSR